MIESNSKAKAVRSARLMVRLALLGSLGVVGMSAAGGCQCYDEPDRGWEFNQPVDAVIVDAQPDAPPDVQPDMMDVRDVQPDTVDVQDVLDPDGFSPPTNVLDDSNCGSRTSLVVDSDGTEWLGFHRGAPETCGPTRSRLTVAHHRRGERNWNFETVDTQEYLQVLAVTQADRPILAYPNPADGTLNVARRRTNGTWQRRTLNVRTSVTGSPGFDTAADEDSYYVSYAGDSSDRVEFFRFDTTNPGQGWTSLASLMRENPSAAFERGLRADTGDSAYLIHRRDGRGTPYGVARYDKQEDRWAQTEYFDSATYRVHSLVVTDDFQLCTAGDVASTLHVTCGTMVDLDQRRWRFTDQPDVMTLPPASMAVGDDGSLYVAFNTDGGADLRVAKLPPQSNNWRVTTIYGSESSGVSTDVAPDGRLIVSFFGCDDPKTSRDACPLKVVREAPDNL